MGLEIYIGIFGACLILFSWIFETVKSFREHKALIDLKFSIINLFAVSSLSFYSYFVKDSLFIFLNLAIFAIVVVEIILAIHLKKHRI